MRTKIRSKFSWVHGYLAFGFLLFIYVGMLLAVISTYLDTEPGESVHQEIFWIIILSILLTLFILSMLRTTKRITITSQSIIFRTIFKCQEIRWSEIRSIKLHGKEGWLWTPQEATTLFLHDGKKIFFLDALYRNTPLLKLALNRVKQQGHRVKDIDFQDLNHHQFQSGSSTLPNDPMTKYSGHFWFTFNGIGLMVSVVFLLVGLKLLLVDWNMIGTVILLFSFAFIVLIARHLNYFYLGRHHLVVRNHIWRPYVKVFHLNDIVEVVFDQVGNGSEGLRVITKDFKSKFFPAGSLERLTWQKIEKSFKKKKIKVRSKYE